MKSFFRLLSYIFIIFLLSACAKLTVKDFKISETEMVMHAGETSQLKVAVSFSGADTLEIKFTSSVPEVASVDNKGNVLAIEPGNTVITVQCENLKAECRVTVNPQVCVAGHNVSPEGVTTAFYYIDGNFSSLGNGTKAYSVILHGDDVLVAGEYSDLNSEDGVPHAVYWKNGSMVSIDESSGMSSASDIAVSGDSIVVAGNLTLQDGTVEAYLWTPNSRQLLAGESEAFSVCVSGDVVIIGGVNAGRPAVWRNGNLFLFDGYGCINDMVCYDGKLYAAGFSFESGVKKAALWIDGEKHELTGRDSEASGVSVYKDNVAVCGSVAGGGAFVWSQSDGFCETSTLEGAVTYRNIALSAVGEVLCGSTAGYDLTASSVVRNASIWRQGVPLIIVDAGSNSEAVSVFVR